VQQEQEEGECGPQKDRGLVTTNGEGGCHPGHPGWSSNSIASLMSRSM
jgi:hypothetical protein